LRLLFLMPRFHSNMAPFVSALCAAGVDVRMLVLGVGGGEDHAAVVPDVIPVSSRQPFLRAECAADKDFARYATRVLPALAPLYSALRSARPDFVVCRGLTPVYILCALPFVLVRSRLVLYTQGAIVARRGLRKRLGNALILALCGGRWYSPVERKSLHVDRAFAERRMTYIPFSMRVDPLARDRDWCVDRLRLLAVGKFLPRKNHELLVRALGALTDERVSLSIVGEVTTESHRRHYSDIESLVWELGLTGRVQLLVNVPHADMAGIYRSHDVYLQVSSDEPASVSQLEAMAGGMGVIIDPTNGTASYVVDGCNGRYCPPSLELLAPIIAELANSPAIVAQWGRASMDIVDRHHRPEDQVRTFLEMLSR